MESKATVPVLDWALQWVASEKRLYYGGEWNRSESSQRTAIYNPSDASLLVEVPDGNAKDVDRAVNAARAAFDSGPWRRFSRRQRAETLQQIGRLIRKHASELATLESLNNGKTFQESSQDDLPESADVFDYYAGWTDKIYGETSPTETGELNFTRREPVGVCALVVPWNFPLLLGAWKIAAALGTGNTVVVKPSPFTPLTLLRLAEIIHEARILPPGVFNVILGGTEAGRALSEHAKIDKISFTGSTEVGRAVVRGAAANLKTVTLELGGKSPNIIFNDATDLPAVIQRSFTAMFSHKGEKCSEPTRFLIQKDIYKTFVQGLLPLVEKVRCGDPFEKYTTQGPQCHRAHFEKILNYIDIGLREGAKLLAGGTRDISNENEQGYFIRPTVFGEVANEMRIAREEIFGPVVCLIPFDTEEDAVRIANDTMYGLAAGVYTADVARAHRLTDRLEAGMVFVNHYGCYDFASPFGGFKQSGWGKELAAHSLDAYTRRKSVWIKY